MNMQPVKCIGICLGIAGALAVSAPNAAHAQNYWRHGRYYHQNFGSGERLLRWSGSVDNRTTISMHGRMVRSSTYDSKPNRYVHIDANRALPRVPGRVSLRDWSGRGEVHVVQQPRRWNNYTAAVRINDPQPGRSHYSFTLAWHPM